MTLLVDAVREAVRSLNDLPLAGLMLVVTLGFLAGRLSWRGVSLGPAGGTLGVALLFGSLGLSFRALYGSDDPVLTIGQLGFALFIYSVGFEAGPRFFSNILGGPGWRFVLVGTLVNVLAVVIAVVGGRLLGLGSSAAAGLLAGALTSAPAYAAADEVCSDRTALAVSFALVYPVGLVGVVVLIQVLPRLLRDDLSAGTSGPDDDDRDRGGDPELVRLFEVTRDEMVGPTLAELALSRRTGCYITRVHRGDGVFVPDASTRLAIGDRLAVKGRLDELREFAKLVGEEVDDAALRRDGQSVRRIQVQSAAVAGRTLAELDLTGRHHCLVTAIRRGAVTLEPGPAVALERGDVVDVLGDLQGLRAVAAELGRFERPPHETDIAVYAGGIFLGLVLSNLHVRGFNVDLRLGTAGGLLLTGVILGRFRRVGPLSAHVPPAARQLVRDLGILLFIAETGVKAGGSPLGDLTGIVWGVLAVGALTTVAPIVVAVVVGRRVLRMRPVDSWGAVCGAMTSSAALVVLRRAADSDEPAISYAAAYAVASVLVTVAGQVVIYLSA